MLRDIPKGPDIRKQGGAITQLQGCLPLCLPLLEVGFLPSFPDRVQALGWVSPTFHCIPLQESFSICPWTGSQEGEKEETPNMKDHFLPCLESIWDRVGHE